MSEGDKMTLFENNLNNIQLLYEKDMFGEKIDKLSVKDRIGFSPISIWQPDWTKTKKLKVDMSEFV